MAGYVNFPYGQYEPKQLSERVMVVSSVLDASAPHDDTVWRLEHQKARYTGRYYLFAAVKDGSLLTSTHRMTNLRWVTAAYTANDIEIQLVASFGHEPSSEEIQQATDHLQSELAASLRKMYGLDGPE